MGFARKLEIPILLASTLSIDPNSSLTVWDASLSHQTLFVMLAAAVIFMPIILAYTAWVYKVLWGKVTAGDIGRTMPSFAILPSNIPNMVIAGAAETIHGLRFGYLDYLMLHYPVLAPLVIAMQLSGERLAHLRYA